MKPDLKSYYKSQLKFNFDPVTVCRKTGVKYIEIHSKIHWFISLSIYILLLVALLFILQNDVILYIISSLVLLLAFLFVCPILIYYISKFKVVDDDAFEDE